MLTIGDDTLVAPGVDVFTHNQENQRYTYEPVAIGRGCVLGERASVMGHTKMADGVQLLPMAQGMKHVEYIQGQVYGGNPAGLLSAAAAEAVVGRMGQQSDGESTRRRWRWWRAQPQAGGDSFVEKVDDVRIVSHTSAGTEQQQSV